MSTVTWDAILVTVDGFGFGTLTGESCLKNVHCHTDRASWDAILVTSVAFGALMWENCAQSRSFGLGRVGGDTIGGNRDHIGLLVQQRLTVAAFHFVEISRIKLSF